MKDDIEIELMKLVSEHGASDVKFRQVTIENGTRMVHEVKIKITSNPKKKHDTR